MRDTTSTRLSDLLQRNIQRNLRRSILQLPMLQQNTIQVNTTQSFIQQLLSLLRKQQKSLQQSRRPLPMLQRPQLKRKSND